MRNIKISDVTMKQTGKGIDFSLSFREKIELAKLLDRLEVSVIELHPIENLKIDSLLIKSIAGAVKNAVIAVPVALEEGGAEKVWNALKEAKKPRLQVCAPTSPVQMEYLSHKKPEAMLEAIKNAVSACKTLCSDVEFVAGDSTRSDENFLEAAVKAAVEAGASTVTFCDTAGVMLPDEFSAFLENIKSAVPELADVSVGVSCSDALSMADSCAVSAVRCGASEVKATAVATDNVRLAKIAKILAAKGSAFDACGAVRMAEINRVIAQIERLCHSGKSKNSPFDDSVRAEGEWVLTEHDDISAVLKAAESLGYELSEEDGMKVYEAFKQIAVLKKKVGSKELDAIVASSALQVPPTYKLESYVINASNVLTSSAHLRILKGEHALEGICIGDGPIDAAFLAIEQIIGLHYELDDFQIQSVTEGREAMGQTVVKLLSNGKLYSGRGTSTDIVGASILAYLNALNKIVYEEENA
ncbi:MAG: hypothetical protein IJ306_10505 [Oscillospiraceae bacterium]|nr:hypothetical protein [Oscillospiraceae bacterium]